MNIIEHKIKQVAFIGHRNIDNYKNVYARLQKIVLSLIKKGYYSFTMGTHGDFDRMALSICREFKKEYKINIEVVLTSLASIKKDKYSNYVPYSDVNTIIYNIEDKHFKQKIIESNKQMLDNCNIVICYVNSKLKGGAKIALNYAKKKSLEIINLYQETDDLFYGITEQEKQDMLDKILKNTAN